MVALPSIFVLQLPNRIQQPPLTMPSMLTASEFNLQVRFSALPQHFHRTWFVIQTATVFPPFFKEGTYFLEEPGQFIEASILVLCRQLEVKPAADTFCHQIGKIPPVLTMDMGALFWRPAFYGKQASPLRVCINTGQQSICMIGIPSLWHVNDR